MSSIVITVQTASELKLLEEMAKKMGFVAFELSEKDKRLFARRKLSEIRAKFSQLDISEEEILNEVEEVRTARYAQKARKDNH